jgi:hypothetical protein
MFGAISGAAQRETARHYTSAAYAIAGFFFVMPVFMEI